MSPGNEAASARRTKELTEEAKNRFGDKSAGKKTGAIPGLGSDRIVGFE